MSSLRAIFDVNPDSVTPKPTTTSRVIKAASESGLAKHTGFIYLLKVISSSSSNKVILASYVEV